MENSQPLATDSFSYSWLSNSNAPLDGLEDHLRASICNSCGCTSEKFNCSMINSDCLMPESQNFNFDVSVTQAPAVLAHADELFSDGLIRPVYVDPSKGESFSTPDATQTMSSFSFSSRLVPTRTGEIHHGFLAKWRKATRRTLRDLFRYLNKFRQKVGCSRRSTRVDDIDKTEWQVKSWSSSQQASPEPFPAHSVGDLCDHENPIYEAVLHCKRSIEK